MTKKEALSQFIDASVQFNDYWEMQENWAAFIDMLCRTRQISHRQFSNWGNPCTPASFGKWNLKLPKGISNFES